MAYLHKANEHNTHFWLDMQTHAYTPTYSPHPHMYTHILSLLVPRQSQPNGPSTFQLYELQTHESPAFISINRTIVCECA